MLKNINDPNISVVSQLRICRLPSQKWPSRHKRWPLLMGGSGLHIFKCDRANISQYFILLHPNNINSKFTFPPGQCLNLNCALLLTLILRRTITRVRNSALGAWLPCDRHVHLHKMAGWSVFWYSVLHTVFHLANYGGCFFFLFKNVFWIMFFHRLPLG